MFPGYRPGRSGLFVLERTQIMVDDDISSTIAMMFARHMAEAEDRELISRLLDDAGLSTSNDTETVEGQIRYLDVKELKDVNKG